MEMLHYFLGLFITLKLFRVVHWQASIDVTVKVVLWRLWGLSSGSIFAYLLQGVIFIFALRAWRMKGMTMDYPESDYDEDEPKPRPPPIRSLLGRRSVATPYKRWDPILGEWRNAVRFGRQAMTDEQKGAFLEEYLKWGRMSEAAAVAGVSPKRIKALAQEDEEFAEAIALAEAAYRDKLIQHHQNLVFNGTERVNYDRTGNVVSRETIYPIKLIEMELKKHDPGYRDKQELEVKHSGGVLIAPAEINSIEDWQKRFSPQMIDVTPDEEEDRVEIKDGDN